MDSILEQLSDYATELSYDQLPAATVHEVTRRVIDTFGCAMGSHSMEPPRIARAHAMEVTSQPGATVLGTRHRSAPELAAFANGVMARYSDFNDMAVGKKAGHPSDAIMPVLAAAEYGAASVQSAIAGIVLAYEFQDRLGDSCVGVLDGGWDYVIYTAIACAAGAAKAMGLGKKQTANALALAVVPNNATHQTRRGQLSMWKGCAAPNAARNGLFAAMLARRGLTGPDEAFEGVCGFNNQLRVKVELPRARRPQRRLHARPEPLQELSLRLRGAVLRHAGHRAAPGPGWKNGTYRKGRNRDLHACRRVFRGTRAKSGTQPAAKPLTTACPIVSLLRSPEDRYRSMISARSDFPTRRSML